MNPTTTLPVLALIALFAAAPAPAQVPSILNYQGRVTVGGTNLTTNAAQFKFALVDSSGATVYWKNDGTTTTNAPSTAVPVAVAQGLYSTLLGDTALSNMAAIPGDVFTNTNVNLRVWFSRGGTNPFVLLTPDQRLGSAGYALRAAAADSAVVTNIAGNLSVSGDLNLGGAVISATGVNLSAGALGGMRVGPEVVISNEFFGTAGGVNVVGGYGSNNVGEGYYGATIAGGGGVFYGSYLTNEVTGNFGTVGGGAANSAAENAVVAGGQGNSASAASATISGGLYNQAVVIYSVVGGGYANSNSGYAATIAGGFQNTATGFYSAVGGGTLNTNSAEGAFIGAGQRNFVHATASNAVIGGGTDNVASNNYAVVGGGLDNTAGGFYSMVGGGQSNVSSGTWSVVGGGYMNAATNALATVGGGSQNTAGAFYTTIAGGTDNVASSAWAAVGGGYRNSASGSYAVAGGGSGNAAGGNYAVAAGGNANAARTLGSTVSGGESNAAGLIQFPSTVTTHATVGGGVSNTASGGYSTVAGGTRNLVGGEHGAIVGGIGNIANESGGSGGFIGGGISNRLFGDASTISGGKANYTSFDYAAVGGGMSNSVTGYFGAIAGGLENAVHGSNATVGGGYRNWVGLGDTWLDQAGGDYATIGGGYENQAASGASIGGGQQNRASSYAAIAGGIANTATNAYAAIGGGTGNQAAAAYATVPGGVGARVTNAGSFVWSGDDTELTSSYGDNTFTVRAEGGARFITANGNTIGVRLTNGATSWASLSDSNAKTKIATIRPRHILAKLTSLPVTEWEYKEVPDRRYIGPMAQDFHAAFGLGDDTTISTLDSDGVMYAAIQGLVEEIKLRDEKIAQLEAQSLEQGAESKAEIDHLKAELREIREQLSKLPPSP